MKTLQSDYLRTLPEKIKIIEEQIKKNDSNNVRESFHKLKGTGTTYGLPEVTALADIVETICIKVQSQSLAAAGQALPVLRDIHAFRARQEVYPIAEDQRVAALRKLLQSELPKV